MANCGVLVIDDFGRQAMSPNALLNRWIVPMEDGIDHYALIKRPNDRYSLCHSAGVFDKPRAGIAG